MTIDPQQPLITPNASEKPLESKPSDLTSKVTKVASEWYSTVIKAGVAAIGAWAFYDLINSNQHPILATFKLASYGLLLNIVIQLKLTVPEIKSKPTKFTDDCMTSLVNKLEKQPAEFPPVLDRETEIETILDTLSIQGMNNVILVGPAGSGKTAIAKEITRRMTEGKMPPSLKDYTDVVEISINDLVSGTNLRGQLEEKLKTLIAYIEKHKKTTIFFIDEIHMLSNRRSSSSDESVAANALKPILAAGATLIGATTSEEYAAHFSSQAGALSRRFAKVTIEPQNAKAATEILKQIKADVFEEPYEVTISEPMIELLIAKVRTLPSVKCPLERAIHFLHRVCVHAKRTSNGKVTKRSIAAVVKGQQQPDLVPDMYV